MSEATYRVKPIPKFADPRVTPTLDPRLCDMLVGKNRILKPENEPQPGRNSHWLYTLDDMFRLTGWSWENEPKTYGWGRGMGLPEFSEVPRFRSIHSKAASEQNVLCDFYPCTAGGLFIGAKRFSMS